MAQIEPLLTSYNEATSYPLNVAESTLAPYAVDVIRTQLNTQATRLFAHETKAALDFLDLGINAGDFWPSRITSAERLREHLGIPPSRGQSNHRCRFLFVHAAHSRDRLKVSRDMLMLCFSHFQVIPEFVDFLFPFGYQSYKQDFYFSGFRQKTQLAEHWRNNVPNARFLRKNLQVCYNLKSVEPSDTEEWSIRHCAVHHSFDLEEVRTSWIIIKGDEFMKRLIESATSNRGLLGASDFGSLDRAFNASLETHLIFCDWSTENWRWYINDLEDRFQHLTRRTFSAPIHLSIPSTAEQDQYTLSPRTNIERTERSRFSLFSRTQSHVTEKVSLKPPLQHRLSSLQKFRNPDTGISQPLPPDEDDDDEDEPECSVKPTDIKVEDETREFSFAKLRKIHEIAEKANEAVLVLKQNINILSRLRNHYKWTSNRRDFPKDLAYSCKNATEDFTCRIEGLENDMQIQILRLETLLRLLGDRKTLVKQITGSRQFAELKQDQLHSILDYQNTQANKYSTNSMSKMTEDMNEIARKTKIETVSMRVITLVTLFFLPGTFISTLMSTEIFQPHGTGPRKLSPYAHLSPLQLYLALSLPLTVVTLLFWAGCHFWDMRCEKQKEKLHKDTNWQT